MHERIAARAFNTPLAYDARKAATVAAALGPSILGAPVRVNGAEGVSHVAFANGRPSAGVLGDRLGRAMDTRGRATYDMVGSVAVIPIEGTLVHKGGWLESNSGETSYQGLQTQIARAAASNAVKGVVFEVDSFGGEVSGAFETAAAIRALSKAKPTIAILTDFAYSAGYLLASQARQVVAPKWGGAGSIGIVMMHADVSGFYEKQGVTITVLQSGKHKTDGGPLSALAPEIAAKWTATMDAMRDDFAAAVAAGRGRRFTKAAALKTEATAYEAGEAASLGLIDAIADPQQTFAAFVAAINGS